MEPSGIDSGERAAGVLGAKCVVTKEIEKVTAEQRKRINDLEAEISGLAKSLCAGTLKTTWPAAPAYKWLDKNLARGFDVEQVQAMISTLPPETQLPYMAVAQKQFDFLREAFPRASRETLYGPVAMPADIVAQHRFAGLWRVIDSPLYVFELMAGSALLRNQAQSVRLVFPTLSTAIDNALEDAMADARAKDSEWEMPWKADAGVRDWRGMPTLLKPFQVAFVEDDAKRDVQMKPSEKAIPPESAGSLSAAQSAMYRQIGG